MALKATTKILFKALANRRNYVGNSIRKGSGSRIGTATYLKLQRKQYSKAFGKVGHAKLRDSITLKHSR